MARLILDGAEAFGEREFLLFCAFFLGDIEFYELAWDEKDVCSKILISTSMPILSISSSGFASGLSMKGYVHQYDECLILMCLFFSYEGALILEQEFSRSISERPILNNHSRYSITSKDQKHELLSNV